MTFDIYAAINYTTEPWMAYGACLRSGEDPDDWFPKRARGLTTPQVRHAVEVCGTCPVVYQCLDFAITYTGLPRPLEGVWGGTTQAARKPAVLAFAEKENQREHPRWVTHYPGLRQLIRAAPTPQRSRHAS